MKRGFIVLSRNTSTTWSGPVYFFQEKNGHGPRFGECYTQEKATIVSRQRFDELKDKRIIPEKAEFVCVAQHERPHARVSNANDGSVR